MEKQRELEKVSAKEFYNAICKEWNELENKELVDIHSLSDYEKTENYLTADKKSGFAITKDNDFISVFNNSKQRGFLKSVADFVKVNAKTLDCYISKKMDLSQVYSNILDFKIASILKFDYDFLVADKGEEYAKEFIKKHGKSDVAFMVNTNKDIKVKYFTDYQKAVEYRNSYC